MPVYDYRCLDCGNKFALRISYEDYGNKAVACPNCDSPSVSRRISRVRIGHSEEERLSKIADPALLDAVDDDPVALGGMLRQMKDEMGEEIAPEFDDVVDRLERDRLRSRSSVKCLNWTMKVPAALNWIHSPIFDQLTAWVSSSKLVIPEIRLRKSANPWLRSRSARTAGPTGSSPAAPPG